MNALLIQNNIDFDTSSLGYPCHLFASYFVVLILALYWCHCYCIHSDVKSAEDCFVDVCWCSLCCDHACTLQTEHVWLKCNAPNYVISDEKYCLDAFTNSNGLVPPIWMTFFTSWAPQVQWFYMQVESIWLIWYRVAVGYCGWFNCMYVC